MDINGQNAIKAFTRLSQLIEERGRQPTTLFVGGGCALIVGYGFNGATSDVDAVTKVGDLGDLADEVHQISVEFGFSRDWMNPHFSSFLHAVPSDFESRLIQVFRSANLTVFVLGAEDLLILKLMAGRQKDSMHIRFLLKRKVNLVVVEERLVKPPRS